MYKIAGMMIAGFFLLLPISSAADDEQHSDGNALLADCGDALKGKLSSATAFFKAGFCQGHIIGISSYNEYLNAVDAKRRVFCVPGSVTLNQNIRVVMKYLNEHPERLHFPDTLLIIEAFRESFPCR